jgi:hypothetical protein
MNRGADFFDFRSGVGKNQALLRRKLLRGILTRIEERNCSKVAAIKDVFNFLIAPYLIRYEIHPKGGKPWIVFESTSDILTASTPSA